MSCGCAGRLRGTLKDAGYRLINGVWHSADGRDEIRDEDVDSKHAAITAMRPRLWKQAGIKAAEAARERARSLGI